MTDSERTTPPPGKEIATLAGGCFWCLEAVYDQMKGVESVESGYMGGHTASPTYTAVCSGATGHAEVVRIIFDPKVASYKDLLNVFFVIHDPTTLNRQGNDVGTQYRSAVFAQTPEQKRIANQVIASLTANALRNAHRFEALVKNEADAQRDKRTGELQRIALIAASVPASTPGSSPSSSFAA
jgi:peptide-methionine (S)-S-oxide reductase